MVDSFDPQLSSPVLENVVAMDERARVLRFGETLARNRGGGVHTRYLVTHELGARRFLNGITEFDPGSSLPFHFHNCDESVVVLEGEAAFETESATTLLRAFDTTWVPAEVVH